MQGKDLTGIERQLVLRYLIDGNVPVTVNELTDEENEDEIQDGRNEGGQAESDSLNEESEKPVMQKIHPNIFPVAIPGEQMKVLDQGIILLQNPKQAVQRFDGKDVKVKFYFNKIGLYFVTKMKKTSSGLALVIPSKITRIDDIPEKPRGTFDALLYLSAEKEENTPSVKCTFLDDYRLFSQPKWSDVEESLQQKTKSYLEKIVMDSRANGKSIGNGLFIINVSRYLAENHEKTADEMIKEEIKAPSVIFIDEQRIVFAAKKDDIILQEECEYEMRLGFPIPKGPIKERVIFLKFEVERLFYDDEEKNACAVCSYSSIKEEDVRFLQDKAVL